MKHSIKEITKNIIQNYHFEEQFTEALNDFDIECYIREEIEACIDDFINSDLIERVIENIAHDAVYEELFKTDFEEKLIDFLSCPF